MDRSQKSLRVWAPQEDLTKEERAEWYSSALAQDLT